MPKIVSVFKMRNITKDLHSLLPSLLPSRTRHNFNGLLQSTGEHPEKCVTLNILAEPPTGSPIRADIIFIHGLHGA